MKQGGKKGGFYAYLASHGILGQGTERIEEARRLYRKEYQKNYKKAWRKKVQECVLALTPFEQKLFTAEAEKMGVPVAQYVRQAAACYADRKYLVPHQETVTKMLQSLLSIRADVRFIYNRDKSSWLKPNVSIEQLHDILTNTQKEIQAALVHPLTLEERIRQEIKDNPSYLFTLKKMLAEYDTKEHRPEDRQL